MSSKTRRRRQSRPKPKQIETLVEAPQRSIDTLVSDIYSLFDKGADLSNQNTAAFASVLASIIKDRFASYKDPPRKTLRMSNIGKNPLQLWYDIHGTHEVPKTTPQDKLKFLYGDILECLLIFLAKEAGHSVTNEQQEVVLDGVVGHLDGVIDGVVTDVKSTSKWAFGKFQSESTLRADDSFGYVEQLSGYCQSLGKDRGAFLVIDKESGQLGLCELKPDDVRPRIRDLKDILAHDQPPFVCTQDKPEGLSGNRSLSYPCTYCPHKHECWKHANGGQGLIAYEYSTGTKYLTNVAKEPRVNKKESN